MNSTLTGDEDDDDDGGGGDGGGVCVCVYVCVLTRVHACMWVHACVHVFVYIFLKYVLNAAVCCNFAVSEYKDVHMVFCSVNEMGYFSGHRVEFSNSSSCLKV